MSNMAGEKTIFIEIFQPFAQYRNPFTFYYAQTYPLPPKSTVIGMLQNATRRYYDSDFWKLKVSVHGGFESVFWNYQNLIKGDIFLFRYNGKVELWNQNLALYNKGLKSQRSPVNQQELFNGHVYILIRGKENIINEIQSSLDKPSKVLYLGRSEDVIFIRNISEISASEIEQKEAKKSVWLDYPTYLKKEVGRNGNKKEFPIKNQKYPVYSIPVFVAFYNDNNPIKNKAEITKKTKREVKFETVVYTGFDYVVKLSKPLEFEEIVIGDKRFRIFCEYGWL